MPRSLCLRGAEILIWASRSWGSQGDLHTPANRAYENVTPLIHCDGWQHCDAFPDSRSHAMICDHAGRVLAVSQNPDELAYAELDPDAARYQRRHGGGPMRWQDLRQPALYGPL